MVEADGQAFGWATVRVTTVGEGRRRSSCGTRWESVWQITYEPDTLLYTRSGCTDIQTVVVPHFEISSSRR